MGEISKTEYASHISIINCECKISASVCEVKIFLAHTHTDVMTEAQWNEQTIDAELLVRFINLCHEIYRMHCEYFIKKIKTVCSRSHCVCVCRKQTYFRIFRKINRFRDGNACMAKQSRKLHASTRCHHQVCVCVCLVFGVRVNFRRAGDSIAVEYEKTEVTAVWLEMITTFFLLRGLIPTIEFSQ